MEDTQPKFQKIWDTFCNFGIFSLKNRFFCPMRRATWRSLLMGTSFLGKLKIFGFFMEKYACSQMAKKFWQVLSFQKGQKHLKNDLSTPFWHTGRSLGRTHFWRGKWRPNSTIPLVLESIQEKISKNPTWRKFGYREGLQKQLQKGAMHREISAAHWRNFCSV